MPTFAVTVASCGKRTFSRPATKLSALRKQRHTPRGKELLGIGAGAARASEFLGPGQAYVQRTIRCPGAAFTPSGGRGFGRVLHVDGHRDLLEARLCFAIYQANHAFTGAYRPVLKPFGLTYPQYLVLVVLWEAEGATVKAIGQRLGLDFGTLTPLLKRMEAQELVRRSRDPADERQLCVTLTRKGRALEAEAAGIRESLACRVVGDRDALCDALRALTKALREPKAAILSATAGGRRKG